MLKASKMKEKKIGQHFAIGMQLQDYCLNSFRYVFFSYRVCAARARLPATKAAKKGRKMTKPKKQQHFCPTECIASQRQTFRFMHEHRNFYHKQNTIQQV